MEPIDKEVFELCKEWFNGIIDKCDRLTTGNVSHQKAVIRTTAKECITYINLHLKRSTTNEEPFRTGRGIIARFIEENNVVCFTEEEISEILFCLEGFDDIAAIKSEVRTNLIHKLQELKEE